MTTAYVANPSNFTGPVQLSATALFDSSEGSLQVSVLQQVRPGGGSD
jgi:hypothetical protein